MAQFKSINSSALSFLYNPNLTSILDYWKNHSLDWMDLCHQSNFMLQILHFMLHISHLCTTTGKTIALTRLTFLSKVMSLLLVRCLGFS